MTPAQLRTAFEAVSPEEIVRNILERGTITVFPAPELYAQFRQKVSVHFQAEEIFVMGSANLGYSLNPEKKGLLFRRESDIDTVLISEPLFMHFWHELRAYHRQNYYLLDYQVQSRLRRRGQDVYTGFVSPKFIPDKIYPIRRDFERSLDKLSDELVGFREVRAFIFRSRIEVYDYYKRGLIQFVQSMS